METYGKVGDVFMDLLACKLENRGSCFPSLMLQGLASGVTTGC